MEKSCGLKNIKLERIQNEEIYQLLQFATDTFTAAFGHLNNPKDFKLYMDNQFNIEQIRHEFENPGSRFYFAKNDDIILGYFKLNIKEAQSEIFFDNSIELERIYTAADQSGMGIGKIMLDKAIQIGLREKHDYIWLGVWEKNSRAIKFYQRHGFELFGQHDFMMGNDRQIDLLMKKKL